jgi:hypothetical protein
MNSLFFEARTYSPDLEGTPHHSYTIWLRKRYGEGYMVDVAYHVTTYELQSDGTYRVLERVDEEVEEIIFDSLDTAYARYVYNCGRYATKVVTLQHKINKKGGWNESDAKELNIDGQD